MSTAFQTSAFQIDAFQIDPGTIFDPDPATSVNVVLVTPESEVTLMENPAGSDVTLHDA